MACFTFKTQVGDLGYYAEIFFDAKLHPKRDAGLTMTFGNDAKEWEASTKAGVLIFYDYYSRISNKSLEINIQSVNWEPIHTNHLIVLYSTVKALSDFFKVDIPFLEFSKESKSFTFPEKRNLRRV